MDFVGELLLGFIVRFLRDEGVAVRGCGTAICRGIFPPKAELFARVLCSGGRPAEAEISHKAEQSVKNTPFSLTAGGDNRYTLERLKPERRVLFHAQADYRCGFAAGGGAVYPAGLPADVK